MIATYLARLKTRIHQCLERNAEAAGRLLERAAATNSLAQSSGMNGHNRARGPDDFTMQFWDGTQWRQHHIQFDDD